MRTGGSIGSLRRKHLKCDYVRRVSGGYLDLTVIKIVSSHGTSAAGAPRKAAAYLTQSPLISLIPFRNQTRREASDNPVQPDARTDAAVSCLWWGLMGWGVETWRSLKSTTIVFYDVVFECVSQKNKANRSLDHDSLARLARLVV